MLVSCIILISNLSQKLFSDAALPHADDAESRPLLADSRRAVNASTRQCNICCGQRLPYLQLEQAHAELIVISP